jgi:hypothetical protein
MMRNATPVRDPWAEWLLRGQQQGMSGAELLRQQRGLESDLVRETVAAGFNVQLSYFDTDWQTPRLTRQQQTKERERLAAFLARRGNPTMMSYAEAAQAVLGDRAATHRERTVEITVTQPGRHAAAVAYLRGVRPKR